MTERRRPPRANAPFFMAGGDNDFYGPHADDSDGELFPSLSSHEIAQQQPLNNNDASSQHNHTSSQPDAAPTRGFSSAADAYRSVPTSADHRFSLDGGNTPISPPSPGITPNSARPLLPPNGAVGPNGLGFTNSPSPSQRNSSYRLSYTGPPTAGINPTTPNQRAFPPSAFVDPSANIPDSTSSYGHGSSINNHMRRLSSDEMGQTGRSGYTSGFGAAQRNSSITSFAPPPAPWMRGESWHESQLSISSGARNGTGTLTPRKRSAAPSTLIKGKVEKPWLDKKDPWERVSWWITIGLFIVGILASAVLCFFAYKDVPKLGKLCPVMTDYFDGFDTSSVWTRTVDLGGLRNGDFAMFTGADKNSYVSNGKLFITPTLTEDEIGESVYSGGVYRLDGCTSRNASACNARSGNGRVINPVQSARITTENTYNIRYGRVEVRARLPKGDWLKPQIMMLPQDNEYGPYPVSGEIDIMQARGNSADYPKQGRNFVTSGLHWAPTHSPNMDQFYKTYGWRSMRFGDYSDDYHTYVLEWSPDFLWTYVDKRTSRIVDLRFNKKSFFQRGNFPPTVLNNTNVPVVLQNPWAGSGNSAPFDKAFYLSISLGVGGTDGWFQDDQGGKMWYDGSGSAMVDFANNKDKWYNSWASDETRRAFSIDYVKMWNLC